MRRGGVELWRWQRDQWFVAYSRALDGILVRWGMRPELHLLLVILPPLLLMVALGLALSGSLLGLPYLLLLVGSLIYSEGRGNLRQQVDEYLEFWRFADGVAAGRSARAFATDARRLVPKALASLHRFAVDGLLYRAFTQWFAVVFWLALLGPGGAFGYRLLHLYLAHTDACAVRNRDRLQAALFYIDWIPARALGFAFAVVGNFANCYPVWRQQLAVQGRSAPIFLRYCGVAALSDAETLACQGRNEGARRPEALARSAEQIRELMILLRRSRVAWWLGIVVLDVAL